MNIYYIISIENLMIKYLKYNNIIINIKIILLDNKFFFYLIIYFIISLEKKFWNLFNR